MWRRRRSPLYLLHTVGLARIHIETEHDDGSLHPLERRTVGEDQLASQDAFRELVALVLFRVVEVAVARAARLPSTWGQGEHGGIVDAPSGLSPDDRPPGTEFQLPSSSAPDDSADLIVKRWKRYGKDRLYVNTASGQSLGYLDRITGDLHTEPGIDPEVVRAAAERADPAD